MDALQKDASPPGVWPPATFPLTVVGASVFVSGFFLLAVAGEVFGPAVYAVVLAGSAVLLLPLLVVGVLVAVGEALAGRAWASGFRMLTSHERGLRGLAERGLRYAAFLWLANGAAFWFATLAA